MPRLVPRTPLWMDAAGMVAAGWFAFGLTPGVPKENIGWVFFFGATFGTCLTSAIRTLHKRLIAARWRRANLGRNPP